MNQGELLGFFRWLLPVPPVYRRARMEAMLRSLRDGLAFLTGAHREVHKFAVRRLIETGKPLEIIEIAGRLNLSIDRMEEIAGDLEKRAGLITRSNDGTITSAYPVTVIKTPGRVILATGEEVYAGGALEALAVPYVQGRLRGLPVSGHVTTACAFCRRPLHVLIANDLSFRMVEEKLEARIFLPITTAKTSAEGIIFCFRGSVFFCSEEHAAEERRKNGGVTGFYLALEQCIGIIREFIDIIFGTI